MPYTRVTIPRSGIPRTVLGVRVWPYGHMGVRHNKRTIIIIIIQVNAFRTAPGTDIYIPGPRVHIFLHAGSTI